MLLDAAREQLYVAHNPSSFVVLGLDGRVRHRRQLWVGGPNAVLEYPQLALAADGTLHAAWTTSKIGRYCYRSVQHMQSKDGGATWQRMDGAPLAPPLVADETGPSLRISRDDEYEDHSWLAGFLAKDDKVHFVWSTMDSSGSGKSALKRMNYARHDARTGKRDFHRYPKFAGRKIELDKWNGFLAAESAGRGGLLYCVMAAGERIACLASPDNGDTWFDYALGPRAYTDCYSIGGCRTVSRDGWILGTFTDRVQSPIDAKGVCPVYFFRIKASVTGSTGSS
jgi:hypothetical protein